MTKEEILKKAKELITGDRNDTHGDAFQESCRDCRILEYIFR
jgi:hypothetical protein